jgi:hypothetical protein
VILSSAVFFGITALVVWIVWQVRGAFQSQVWIGYVARGIGLVLGVFAAHVAVAVFMATETPSGIGLAASLVWSVASVLLVVSSVGSSTVLFRNLASAGWAALMADLVLSGILALLLPLGAAGAAPFMWRAPIGRRERRSNLANPPHA